MSKFRFSAMLSNSSFEIWLDVLGRAEQAFLLGAPEREPHLVGGAASFAIWSASSRLNGRAGAVVVDARALRDPVEVRADERRPSSGRRPRSRRSRSRSTRSSTCVFAARRTVARLAGAPRLRRRRSPTAGMPTTRPSVPANSVVAVRVGGVALVEDDRAGRARLLGVGHLDAEVARAALHQCDLAGRRAREVGRFAAATCSRAGARRRSMARSARSCHPSPSSPSG